MSTLLFAEIGVAKLHTFWLLLRLKLGFFRIFIFFSLSTLLFVEIGVAKLHTFWLLLKLKLF